MKKILSVVVLVFFSTALAVSAAPMHGACGGMHRGGHYPHRANPCGVSYSAPVSVMVSLTPQPYVVPVIAPTPVAYYPTPLYIPPRQGFSLINIRLGG